MVTNLYFSLIPEINLFGLHGKMNNKRYKIFDLFCKSDKGKYRKNNFI